MEPLVNNSCCGGEKMVVACSGAADVGALSDRAARQLAQEGSARMFCSAAIGAGFPDMIAKAREADKLLVIDGCVKNCAAQCMENAGVTDFLRINIEAMGMPKGQSPVTTERVTAIVGHAQDLLNGAKQ